MNASPTMAVVMAPAAAPGSVPAKRAGEVCSVTKVSEGRRDGVAGAETREIATGPSFFVMADWLSYYWSRVLDLYMCTCVVLGMELGVPQYYL